MVDQDPLVPEAHVLRETWRPMFHVKHYPPCRLRGPGRTELNETVWIEPPPGAGSGEL